MSEAFQNSTAIQLVDEQPSPPLPFYEYACITKYTSLTTINFAQPPMRAPPLNLR